MPIEYSLMTFSIWFCDIVSFPTLLTCYEKWYKLTINLSKPYTYSDFFREKISLEYFSIFISIEFDEIIESSRIFPDFTDDVFSRDRTNFWELFIECTSEYYLHTAVSRALESRENLDFISGVSNDLSNIASSYLSIAHNRADSSAGVSSMVIFFFGMWSVALVINLLYPSS